METYYQEILDLLERLHGEIHTAVKGLSQEAVDWAPGPEMNSMGVLLAHMAGSEKYWLGEVVAAAGSERDRAAEFATQGVPLEALLARLEDSLRFCRGVLAGLKIADLPAPRISPRDGRQVTVGWALAHGLQHIGQHCGHLQVTRQFYDLSSQS